MPNMDGRDVLREVGKDEKLQRIPLLVLTTSNASVDVLACYELGCRAYHVKPLDFDEFQVMVQHLCQYWFDFATLPPSL